ncbi:M24 family metallopeptidase [Stappia sp. GBMRC 2046]|uniref:M24 family metallopeptidase n=1 Tax=Stappia sediminis TaxID=2692190 RepID=A0A7X3LR26_9HYPH|nr:aminopeptidase P family protein [Stappia sediminis]MXN63533.1 M24 family metallopeptidase [Stappia sediminis]
MFQSFDSDNDPTKGAARAASLRAELAARGLDGFLVPRADAHQGEYVPPSEARLQWLTGFAGSAGIAVVLSARAAIFVDGRYTIQVREQVDTDVFEPKHLIETPPAEWLKAVLNPGAKLGFDPTLHTVSAVRRLEKACKAAGAELVAVENNPIDAVWEDRPQPPVGAVALHPLEFSGEGASSKITRIAEDVAAAGADVAVLTQPDSIAWLFNIRGSDVEHTPLPLSFALLPAEGRPTLFIDARKLTNSVRDYLSAFCDISAPEGLLSDIAELGKQGRRVMLDPDWTGEAIARAARQAGGTIVETADPVLLPKAIKNEAEIDGARSAHLRDGAAFTRFLAWFDRMVHEVELDEIAVAEALEGFRGETGRLKEISFDTISAAGPHAAIPHYRVSRQSSLKIPGNSLFLIDSGAQYEDGTTDITRTIAVGDVPEEQKRHFTLVLKGHIAIATALFPAGTTGAQLDTLARHALWAAGYDFDHGTGHGVGSYLSVHEGPQRIAKTGTVPLKAGMILSNEPGYYKTGSHGIRIENLELVREAVPVKGGDRNMHRFEALTLAPIDLRLVVKDLLSPAEVDWLNTYHARVLAEVGPLVDSGTREWLEQATRPI